MRGKGRTLKNDEAIEIFDDEQYDSFRKGLERKQ